MKTLNELAEEYRQEFKDAKISDLFNFPLWGEDKWDGEFVVVFISQDRIRIANRHESIYEPTSLILPKLPKVDCVLLAEYISLRGDLYCYLSDRSKPDCPTLALRVHSIVYLGNRDCRDLDYETRWNLLRQLIPQDTEHVQLVRHRKLIGQGTAQIFYDEAREQGREGIVLKPCGSLREAGQKVKPKITLDVAVLGIKKSKKWKEKKIPNSFVLGTLENGIWKRFGESSSGLTDSERKGIGETVLANKTGEDRHFIYCRPTIVLEIVCQEVKEGGYRHPRIIRIRDDKTVNKVTPREQVNQLVKCILDDFFQKRNGNP